jgi:hypothetical protein
MRVSNACTASISPRSCVAYVCTAETERIDDRGIAGQGTRADDLPDPLVDHAGRPAVVLLVERPERTGRARSTGANVGHFFKKSQACREATSPTQSRACGKYCFSRLVIRFVTATR